MYKVKTLMYKVLQRCMGSIEVGGRVRREGWWREGGRDEEVTLRNRHSRGGGRGTGLAAAAAAVFAIAALLVGERGRLRLRRREGWRVVVLAVAAWCGCVPCDRL